MPRERTVKLGGKEYVVAQLPMYANKQWRDSLGEPVVALVKLLQGFGDMELDANDIGKILVVVKDLLLGSMDILLGALFAYSPALAADRERIEQEAYDDEAIDALGVVIGLAFPLSRVLPTLGGLVGMPMSSNSPSANGDSGTKLPITGPRRTTTKTSLPAT